MEEILVYWMMFANAEVNKNYIPVVQLVCRSVLLHNLGDECSGEKYLNLGKTWV